MVLLCPISACVDRSVTFRYIPLHSAEPHEFWSCCCCCLRGIARRRPETCLQYSFFSHARLRAWRVGMLRRKAANDHQRLVHEVSVLRATVEAQKQSIATLTERVLVLELSSNKRCHTKSDDNHGVSVSFPPSAAALLVQRQSSVATAKQYGGGGDPCARCGTVVYAAERIVARGNIMHRECFRCADTHCDAKLINSPNWEVLNGSFYCGPHFEQRVKRGVPVERELSASELEAEIQRKLIAAEAAFEKDRQRSPSDAVDDG